MEEPLLGGVFCGSKSWLAKARCLGALFCERIFCGGTSYRGALCGRMFCNLDACFAGPCCAETWSSEIVSYGGLFCGSLFRGGMFWRLVFEEARIVEV